MEKKSNNQKIEYENLTNMETEPNIWKSTYGLYIFWISALTTIFSLFIISDYGKLKKYCENTPIKSLDLIVFIFWIIGPPVYFLVEYHYFPIKYKKECSQLSDLKFIQELSTKVWAGLIVIISLILGYKYGIKIG